MYKFYCHISELEPVILQKTGLEFSADELIDRAVKEGVRGVVLSNPCNPTSKGLCREDVLKIASALLDKLIVIDEAYMDFWEEGIINCVGEFDNVILLKTCSKAFGLAAIRLGFAVSNRKLSKALAAVKSPYNVNTMTNVAGALVLSHPDYLRDCIRRIKEQKEKLYNILKDIEKESGRIKAFCTRTNFVFAECEDAGGVYRRLLEKGIAVRQLGGFLRITAGSDADLEKFASALKEAL